jgi:hypothetical protein
VAVVVVNGRDDDIGKVGFGINIILLLLLLLLMEVFIAFPALSPNSSMPAPIPGLGDGGTTTPADINR